MSLTQLYSTAQATGALLTTQNGKWVLHFGDNLRMRSSRLSDIRQVLIAHITDRLLNYPQG